MRMRFIKETASLFCLLLLLTMTHSILADNNVPEPINISLLKPEVSSSTHLLNLQEELDGDSMFYVESDTADKADFALLNLTVFRSSLSSFFLDQERNKSFVDYRTLQGSVKFSLIAGADYHTSDNKSYLHFYRGAQVRGNIKNRLLFWGDWWAGRFQGDLEYAEKSSPLIKGFHKPHNENQEYTNLDRLTGQITYLFPIGNLTVGRGTHLVGNNIGGSIILNNDANDYGYFSGELSFGKLKLSLLHSSLIPDNLKDYPPYSSQDRFLVLHQIDFYPYENLNLFFGEEIIYANRSIDFSYLLPHTFYRITEHNLGDRDNVIIYSGLNWRVADSTLLYGNLALDELRKSEIFGDWWGNKYALQGGVSFSFGQNLFTKTNQPIQTTFEVTAVRPWMYTHKISANAFSNDGIGLGFPEGSNLIQLAEEIALPITSFLTFNHHLSYTKQGSVGNHYSINYNDRPSNTAKWLEGEVTKRLKSCNVLTISVSAHQQIKIGVELKKQDRDDWEKELVIGYKAIY